MGQAIDPPLHPARARIPKRLLALRGDDHLAARIREGDEAAFEVVYDRYAGPLLSFCRHMLGRAEEAEDAVQQVFASAHSDLQRNSRPVALKAWLYAIARNRCLSILRARREQPEPDVEPTATGLQQQVQERAELRQLVADLSDLPDNQRAALLLTELDDLSHTEVAEVLECEASQVKGLVFRARSGLIERRDAREAPCEEIRAELASARRGGLRRGRLRHHLAQCEGCSAYLEEVRRQRRMMALILPVIPATGLKRSVLAAAGIGTGAGGAGGLTVAGGSILSGTAAKVAMVGALAGGAGVAGEEVVNRDRDQRPPQSSPAAARQAPATKATPSPAIPATRPAAGPRPPARRKAATKKPPPAHRGQPNARSRGKSRSNRGASPPGLARRPAKGLVKPTPAKPATPPGQIRQKPAQPVRKPVQPVRKPAQGRGTPARGVPAPAPQAGPKPKSK